MTSIKLYFKCRDSESSVFSAGRGYQDLQFMEEGDLAGLPLKPIERRRLLERVLLLQVAVPSLVFYREALASSSISMYSARARCWRELQPVSRLPRARPTECAPTMLAPGRAGCAAGLFAGRGTGGACAAGAARRARAPAAARGTRPTPVCCCQWCAAPRARPACAASQAGPGVPESKSGPRR